MSDYAIRVEGLVKRFGEVVALDGIDFEVPQGTVFGLLGPNGAGKTTAVRILTTILQPDGGQRRGARPRRGQATADGRAASDRPRRPVRGGRREPHRPREPAHGRAAHPPADARRSCRARTSCSSGSSSPTPPTGRCAPTRAACAGGSTSPPRWCTARRCCSSTSPRPGSTRRAATSCGSVIRELVADGTTVLLTTQYLEEADRLAERIVVIDRGRVIAKGTPARAEGAARQHRGRDRVARRARRLRARRDAAGGHRRRPGRARRRHAAHHVERRRRRSLIDVAARARRRASSTPDDARRSRAEPRRRVPRAHRPPRRGRRDASRRSRSRRRRGGAA